MKTLYILQREVFPGCAQFLLNIWAFINSYTTGILQNINIVTRKWKVKMIRGCAGYLPLTHI